MKGKFEGAQTWAAPHITSHKNWLLAGSWANARVLCQMNPFIMDRSLNPDAANNCIPLADS